MRPKCHFWPLENGEFQRIIYRRQIDYIIGNPPYQDTAVGEQKAFTPPVYDKFMDEAYKVGEVVELITPARFLMNAGSTKKDWNEKKLKDPNLKVLLYEQDSSKIFPNTDIKGGVAVTYRDENKECGPIGIFTPSTELDSISAKVIKHSDFISFSTIVTSRTAYRLTNIMHSEHPEAIKQLSNGHPYDMSTNIFDRLPQIFFDKKPDDKFSYIQIYGLSDRKRVYKYVRADYVNKVNNLQKYKVFVPAATGSGALGDVITTPVIERPAVGHTETFISIGCFDTQAEAEACLKYIKSKFTRTMLGILKVTQHVSPEKWAYVPLQDFTASSDIDWSKSVGEIDSQLYEKYGLDDEEIEFIETHVKEME